MRRREFITVLGGAAAAWPGVAWGQTTTKGGRIGVLRVARTSPTTLPAWEAFLNELGRQGFRTGENLSVDMRWADESPDGPQRVATELVRSGVDVLVVEGAEENLKAASSATISIPIVMTVGNFDPIERGYIQSLARPGGNITGIFLRRPEAAAKQVDLLSQAFPDRRHLGILWDAGSADQFAFAEAAAKSLGMRVSGYKFEKLPYEVASAFATFAANSIELLLVQSSPRFAPYCRLIADSAIEHRLPSMFIVRSYVDRGGLMSYGADRVAAVRLAGTFAAKILNGTSPADLPVEQPIKYELVVNLKTAKTMGVELPVSILLRADEVIE